MIKKMPPKFKQTLFFGGMLFISILVVSLFSLNDLYFFSTSADNVMDGLITKKTRKAIHFSIYDSSNNSYLEDKQGYVMDVLNVSEGDKVKVRFSTSPFSIHNTWIDDDFLFYVHNVPLNLVLLLILTGIVAALKKVIRKQ